jgi:hypothetical protein
MAFATNSERHSFPHRIATGYSSISFGPSDIELDHVEGSILRSDFEDGVPQLRRLRREIRRYNIKYDFLDTPEWKALWDFYNLKAEHELYYFYINLYYMDIQYTNEWIAVNFGQKVRMRNFDVVFGTTGITLIENVQATLTHVLP